MVKPILQKPQSQAPQKRCARRVLLEHPEPINLGDGADELQELVSKSRADSETKAKVEAWVSKFTKRMQTEAALSETDETILKAHRDVGRLVNCLQALEEFLRATDDSKNQELYDYCFALSTILDNLTDQARRAHEQIGLVVGAQTK